MFYSSPISRHCVPFGGPPVMQVGFVPGRAMPVITSIEPSSGPVAGGTTVTITGRNFTGATAVHFGANPAASFTADSDTQITAVSPPSI